MDSIVKLHDKIQNMKLGVNRERQITELEEAGLRRLPLVAGPDDESLSLADQSVREPDPFYQGDEFAPRRPV